MNKPIKKKDVKTSELSSNRNGFKTNTNGHDELPDLQKEMVKYIMDLVKNLDPNSETRSNTIKELGKLAQNNADISPAIGKLTQMLGDEYGVYAAKALGKAAKKGTIANPESNSTF